MAAQDPPPIPPSAPSPPSPMIITITPAFCVSEGVFGFCKGFLCGAAWGLVTPFHPVVSSPWLQPPSTSVISTGRWIIRYKLPIVAISMVSNGCFLGSVLGVFNFSNSTFRYVRKKDDTWNYVLSASITGGFYTYIFTSPHRRIMHNRVVGGILAGTILYANLLV
jgi:hypothetical protein